MSNATYIPAWDKYLLWQDGAPVLATAAELEACCCCERCAEGSNWYCIGPEDGTCWQTVICLTAEEAAAYPLGGMKIIHGPYECKEDAVAANDSCGCPSTCPDCPATITATVVGCSCAFMNRTYTLTKLATGCAWNGSYQDGQDDINFSIRCSYTGNPKMSGWNINITYHDHVECTFTVSGLLYFSCFPSGTFLNSRPSGGTVTIS